jgi:hypothetical protein
VNEINSKKAQLICDIVFHQYMFSNVPRSNIYVRSDFRLWNYQPYHSPIFSETKSSTLLCNTHHPYSAICS